MNRSCGRICSGGLLASLRENWLAQRRKGAKREAVGKWVALRGEHTRRILDETYGFSGFVTASPSPAARVQRFWSAETNRSTTPWAFRANAAAATAWTP